MEHNHEGKAEKFAHKFELWVERYGASLSLYVGLDIGGTNTRIALHHSNDDTHPEENVITYKFKAPNTRVILAELERVAVQLAELGLKEVHGACLAGAGRVYDDGAGVEVTNFPKGDENAHLRHIKITELPSALFPPHNTHFINDLESTCYGIKALNERGTLGSYFKTLWPESEIGKSIEMKYGNYLVIAAGTGLGIALLVSIGTGSRRQGFQVLPMEFGHSLVSFAPQSKPGSNDEAKLTAYLSEKLYQNKHTIEYEDIVSGRGLEATYEWAALGHEDAPKTLKAHEIVAQALKEPPSPSAVKALNLHYTYLLRVAKNLSVGLLVKGVFLAGDNQVNNNTFIEQHLKELRAEYLEHPKPHWVDTVELFTQVKAFNLNLHGALHVAREE